MSMEQVNQLQPPHDVSVLVVSCDAYQDLWKPFFSCFFKYWPDCPYPINLGSNNIVFGNSRVHSILVGDDLDYSSNLIHMLEQIPTQWVILWIEDRVLCRSVETSRISELIARAQLEGIGYIKLIASHPFAFVNNPSEEIGEIPKGAKYRVCATVALWDKRVLQKLLRRGETAWQIEKQGSKRSNALSEPFYSLTITTKHNPPISDVHLVVRGKLARDVRKFLTNEGIISELNLRPRQSIFSFLYVRTYLWAHDLCDLAKLSWRWLRSKSML